MAFPCDIPCIVCPPSIGGGVGPVDPANPFVNLSSEDPDHDDFIGRRYSRGWPPLGSRWRAVGCIGWCLSRISQEDADLCAARQAVLCTSVNWPQDCPTCDATPRDPFPEEPRTVFYNNAQFCNFTCPDGSIYTFVAAAGLFASVVNQATVDLMAYSYACNKAVQNHMCLGTLTPVRSCSNVPYSGSIIASTSNAPVTFEIVGELPDGLLLSQNETTAFIDGTPTTPGDYTFTVKATDSLGQSVEKVVELSIFGVATVALADGEVGVPYSDTLQSGGTPSGTVVWSITSGTLPDGLTLDPATGEISGTPTTEETQTMTITVTDGVLTCHRSLGIQVENADCPNWDLLAWDTSSLFVNGGATASFTPDNAVSSVASSTCAITDGLLGSFGTAVNTASIIYNGPGCNCNLRINSSYTIGAFPVGSLDSIQWQVISNLFGILTVGAIIPGLGITDIPFVLPNTGGVNDTIFVNPVALSIDNNNGAEPARSATTTWTFSNVP